MIDRRRSAASRRGWTMLETSIAAIIAIIIVAILIPVALHVMERVRRYRCSLNMVHIGRALELYHGNNRAYPVGSKYQTNPDSPWGTTWWIDIIPYLEIDDPRVPKDWKRSWANVPSSGQFDSNNPNPNFKLVAGLDLSVFQCPASPMPLLNDPEKHVSAVNRATVKDREELGIPVPCYVAISGSAPDMRDVAINQVVPAAHGRTTKDGRYGVLSASGVFPPNRAIPQALLQQRDGLQHTILIGEQSEWGIDDSYDPPVLYDLRSAWPAGAFTGTSGNYGDLSPQAEGINGSGADRCFNITSIRYAINTRKLQAGIIAQNVKPIPPPKEGEPPRPAAKPLPPGPGHNHGIFSAHSGGANVLFADGRVEFLSEDMSVPILQLLSTRDDGKPIPEH